MLSHLALSNFVLVKDLSLTVHAGLSVITGETGAGKSILLSGLSLVCGGRLSPGLVGPYGERAEVSAQFDLPPGHPCRAMLADQELEEGDGTLVLRRTIGADGRSKAFINGRTVPVSVAAHLGADLVEIQGQFDQLHILKPAAHRSLLDEAAGLQPQLNTVKQAHSARETAASELSAETTRLAKMQEDEEYLRHSLEELSRANVSVGEAESLASQRQTLRALSDAADSLKQLAPLLSGDRGAAGNLAKATKIASRLPSEMAESLDAMIGQIDQAWNAVESAHTDLSNKIYELDSAEGELETASERLFFLKDLARKHGCQADELPTKLETMRAELATLDQGQERLRTLRATLQAAEEAYMSASASLSQARHEAAQSLSTAITDELPALKLPEASVGFRLKTEPDVAGGPHGFDRVRLVARTNRGGQEGPLDKVASGGELSRVLLALKLALAPKSGPGPLMIFDEADAGVGGATAAALGARLRALGKDVQVLAVTHSPQMAAAGHQHLKVSKAIEGDHTSSRIWALDAPARQSEVARMIAGSEIGAEATQAAQKLLEEFA